MISGANGIYAAMPLAPRYSWSETDDSVVIQLQGVAIKDQSQLLCGDAFVKVNAPPYLLVLDLHKDVDEEASRATVQGSSLTLSLKKVRRPPGLSASAACQGAAGAHARCASKHGLVHAAHHASNSVHTACVSTYTHACVHAAACAHTVFHACCTPSAQRESGSWGRLTAEGGKDDLRRRRDESIQRAHKRQADAAEARVKRKQQEER